METNSSLREEVCESFSSSEEGYDYDGEVPVSISKELKNAIITQSSLTKEDKVLDLAYCTGNLLKFIEETYECELYGIKSPDNIRPWCDSKKNIKANVVIGQTYNIPFEDEKFNLITSSTALPYFKDSLKSLEEVYRVLKPGSKMIMEHVFYINPIKNLFNKFLKKNSKKNMQIHSLEEIKEALYVIGFKEVIFQKNEIFSYIIIATK